MLLADEIVKVDFEKRSVTAPDECFFFTCVCVVAHGPYIQIIEEPKQVRLASYFLFLYKHDEAAAETRR